MDNIGDIFKKQNKIKKKRATYKWQEEALEAINILKDSGNKKSSIFMCFKKNTIKARIALNDCKELNKLHSLYFLKVFNELIKR